METNNQNNTPQNLGKNTLKNAKMLRQWGVILLILGILGGVITFFSTFMMEVSYEYKFNPMSFVFAAVTFLPLFVTFLIFNVIADISENIYAINNKSS